MKKIIISILTMFVLSLSITLLQTSCTDKANATPQVVAQNKIAWVQITTPGVGRIWTANVDGTNVKMVNLPYSNITDVSVSPDGQTLFFTTNTFGTPTQNTIYSCDMTGGRLKIVFDATSQNIYSITGIKAF